MVNPYHTNMARYKHRWQSWIKDYFSFTKWQRRALLFLLLIIIGAAIAPVFYRYFLPAPQQPADAIVLEEAKGLVPFKGFDSSWQNNNEHTAWKEPADNNRAATSVSYFTFDPNTASEADWLRLGVKPKTVATILKYRSKGGKFRQPEDLLKIFSLPKDQAKALIPYVVIASTASNNSFRRDSLPARPTTPAKNIAAIDINLADTSQWIALPGIGSKLAFRIVNFRDKLGGFYSIEQVGETYALPDSTFQKIKSRLRVNGSGLRTININTATLEQLKMHPYIKWNIANAMIQYRQQHGPYQSVEDLQKIAIVTPEWLQKVAPYFTVQ